MSHTRIPAWSRLGVSIGVPRGPLPGRPPQYATSNQPLNVRDADVGKVRLGMLSKSSVGSLYGIIEKLINCSSVMVPRRFLPHVVIHGRPGTRPDGSCSLASRKREDPWCHGGFSNFLSLLLPVFSSFLNDSEKIWVIRLPHSFRLRKSSPSMVQLFNVMSFVSSNH
jgi:hypothetical protein